LGELSQQETNFRKEDKVTKVMIVGDTHNDTGFLEQLLFSHAKDEVDVVVQLGDFGLMLSMFGPIVKWLVDNPTAKFIWLDGNHDNHEYIETIIMDDREPDHPVPMVFADWLNKPDLADTVTDRLLYAPRGSTTRIGSKNCMFLGGAVSIDRQWRTPGIDWWWNEDISESDRRRAVEVAENNSIDVLFTHDAPSTDYLEEWLNKYGYKNDHASHRNRLAINDVIDAAFPERVYHGHMHVAYETRHNRYCTVLGLAANVNHRGQHEPPQRDLNYIIEDWSD
jgi:Icc-related predicted phosphoesterase